nr:LuxR C-terminal-related transcriptional regulator [Rhodococcus sp. 06-621-2]
MTIKGCAEPPVPMPTTFVGRRAEIMQIKELLARARIVVVTGTAGIGKTRIALQVADNVRRAFDDVHYFLLGDGRTTVADFAAWSADVTASPPNGRTLLVLDGCEQSPKECARLIAEVARHARNVAILATSRRRLDTVAAATWALPPLSLPTISGAPAVRDALRSDALTLFVERASMVYPDFEVTEKDVGAVSELCARLDGLPLALELAAARMRALTPSQLLQRLDSKYTLLVASDESTRSLWSTMEDAYSACTEAERSIWEKISVFAGPFSLDDVEAVCCDDSTPHRPAADIAETVTGLVDKSVITYSTQAGGGVEYRMFGTLRHFGREKLRAADQLYMVQSLHLDWIRTLAQRAAPFWVGPDATEQSDLLLRRHIDVAAALDFALNTAQQPTTALTLCVDLRVHWMAANRLDEGREWLHAALDRHDTADELRAKGLWVMAYLSILGSEDVESGTYVAEGLRLSEELNSALLTAHFTYVRGLACWSQDQPESAALLLDKAFRRYRELGLEPNQREALFILGMVLAGSDRPSMSFDLIEQNLDAMSTDRDWWSGAYVMWLHGYSAIEHGEIERAQALLRDCIITMQTHNDRSILWWCLELLGWAASERSAYRLAAQLFGAAESYAPGVLPPVLSDKHAHHCASIRRALGATAAQRLHIRGMQLPLQAAVELAATDGQPSLSSTAVEAGLERLSDREMQVAVLVARGLSNKEIAASLVVSTRTAEGHVQRILAKRGFTSRSQIAAWVADTADIDTPRHEKD